MWLSQLISALICIHFILLYNAFLQRLKVLAMESSLKSLENKIISEDLRSQLFFSGLLEELSYIRLNNLQVYFIFISTEHKGLNIYILLGFQKRWSPCHNDFWWAREQDKKHYTELYSEKGPIIFL